MLGALPDDLEGYVKLKTVREEYGDGYHDLHGLRQSGKRGKDQTRFFFSNVFPVATTRKQNAKQHIPLTIDRSVDSALCCLECCCRT